MSMRPIDLVPWLKARLGNVGPVPVLSGRPSDPQCARTTAMVSSSRRFSLTAPEKPQSFAWHSGARQSNPGEVRPLLLRFEGGAGFEQPDKFREVGCGYIRHCPELESTMRPPHDVVALPGFDCLG
jgi:hypothetical protein